MTSLLRRLVLASAALLLLASCGDSNSPDESGDAPAPTPTVSGSGSGSTPPSRDPDKSEKPDATDDTGATGERVARERFCPDLDPGEIGSKLGLDGLEVVVDTEPGQGGSQYWTCTIGQSTGTSVGVTLNILDAAADPSSVAATLNSFSTSLGPENCTDVGDEALGPGTRGVDCSGTSSGTGFTMVARAVVVGGTQIECLLASYGPDDLANLQRSAPDICALFRAQVVH